MQNNKQQQQPNTINTQSKNDKDISSNTQTNVIELKQKYNLEKLVQLLIKMLQNQPHIKNLPHRQAIKFPLDGQKIKLQANEWNKTWTSNLQFQKKLSLTFSYFTFLNLTQISLEKIQLDNCQFISFMNLPLLTRLNLGFSAFYSLKPFVKATLPSLEDIHFNVLINPQLKLERSKSPQLRMIIYYIVERNGQIGLNGQFLAKMQTNKNNDLKFVIAIRQSRNIKIIVLSNKKIHKIIN